MPNRENEINSEDIGKNNYEIEIAKEVEDSFYNDEIEIDEVELKDELEDELEDELDVEGPYYFYDEQVEKNDIWSNNIDEYFKKYDERRKYKERKISAALIMIENLYKKVENLEKENFKLKKDLKRLKK